MTTLVSTGQITIVDANDSPNGTLSKDSFSVPTDANGNNGVFSGCTTTMSVFLGLTDDSANWTYSTTRTNVTVTEPTTSRTQTVTAMSADTGSVSITASRIGYPSITKVFSISKNKQGLSAILNYATSEKWAPSTTNISATGMFGGDFVVNGDGNIREWGTDPFGKPALLWKSVNNDTTSNDDGGWNKTIDGLDPNKSYMSMVYFRRISDAASGRFYHGCSSISTIELLNDAQGNDVNNTNPYFTTPLISEFEKNVWYVSVGIIHANSARPTQSTKSGGVYRLSTGQKLFENTEFRMKSDATSQVHRTYLYYSTNSADTIEWWGPGFYEINGNEPSIYGITNQVGSSVRVDASRQPTFTATDGSLDASQSDITFTATTLGIGSANYVWTFTGLETPPVTPSTTNTQVITAAQFGASRSAIITCTVNGQYKDYVTIVRLEKSSAAAGATKNKTYVQSTIPSFENTGDIWYCTTDTSIHRLFGTSGVDVADITPYQFVDATLSGSSVDEIIVPFSLSEAVFRKSGNTLYILRNLESLSGVSVTRSTTVPSSNDRIWFTDGYATVTLLFSYGNNTTLTSYTTLPTITIYPTILTGYYKASTLYRSNGYAWTPVSTSNFISSGLLANRLTGSNGDFYFATDTNILYQKISDTWQSTSTSGAPNGTYVGGTLAETVASNAANALNGLQDKLNKAGDAITGEITFATTGGIFAGNDIDNGVYLGPNGLVGKKAGNTTFAVDTAGNATFGGTLSIGTVSANSYYGLSVNNTVSIYNVSSYESVIPFTSSFNWTGGKLICFVDFGIYYPSAMISTITDTSVLVQLWGNNGAILSTVYSGGNTTEIAKKYGIKGTIPLLLDNPSNGNGVIIGSTNVLTLYVYGTLRNSSGTLINNTTNTFVSIAPEIRLLEVKA